MRHSILGAGGAISNALAYELIKGNEKVRLVSRSNYSIIGTESYKADLTSYDETLQSVQNSDIVYLCVGLPFKSKIWEDLWPRIMQNTIDACKSVNAKLVFIDNTFVYGKVTSKMTEQTPYNPCSKKGEIREKTVSLLESEMKKKNINAMITRSADFYGPYSVETSTLYNMVIRNLMKGKKAQWHIDPYKHYSFTYTIDIAKGMILLSERDECYGQTWHLPTDHPVDGETYIHITSNILGIAPEYETIDKSVLRMRSLFDKNLSENLEMLYRNELDYHFDSSKFNDFFDYVPMSLYGGIKETLDFLKQYESVNIDHYAYLTM
jgi:nucleoside-diphosphate-sugar epimerase